MRRKNPPCPVTPTPKRRRTNPVDHWHSHCAELWAHAEWFVSIIDAPFFTFSEFHQIMTIAMGLGALRESSTRLQLARVRAAMCNAIPGRFAQPRRLSSAFLAAEVDELCMFRADARRMLRGLHLLPAADPTTMTALPPHWWTRYRCPPPQKPACETPLFVRTTLPPPRLSTSPCHHASRIPSSPPRARPPDTRLDAPRVYVRPAVFLALDADTHMVVRFTDDNCQHTACDLDVMLMFGAQPTTPAASNPATVEHSPLSSRMAFSPQSFFDPLALDTPGLATDASAALAYLYSSPRPVLPSPMRPLSLHAASPGTVECEVDTRQIAESMRLLDRKADIIIAMRRLNDLGETERPQPLTPSAQQQYEQCMRDLALVNDDLRLVLARDLSLTPVADATINTLNFNSPEPRPPSLGNIGGSPGATPDAKSAIGNTQAHAAAAGTSATQGMAAAAAMGVARMMGSPSGPSDIAMRRIPPEALAKNTDFEKADGAATLAKAITRVALANLPNGCALKKSANALRADVMECVSACVTVLIRARATRDLACIEQAVEAIPVQFGENSEALEAIHTAARAFDSSSTDSI